MSLKDYERDSNRSAKVREMIDIIITTPSIWGMIVVMILLIGFIILYLTVISPPYQSQLPTHMYETGGSLR